MKSDHIVIERKNGIATLRLNRPRNLNALDSGMLAALGSALDEVRTDKNITVAIITGTKTFCSGADVRELMRLSPEKAVVLSRLAHEIFGRIESAGKPVIAAVNGYAVGGGCELALACDIRIAGKSAKFWQPEAGLGVIPGFGGTQRLVRAVGFGRAKELIMTGRQIGAIDAEVMGLVSYVVGDDELMERAEEIATALSRKSAIALKIVKGLLNETAKMEEGLAMESIAFSECFGFEDYKEGIKAFLEKKEARFK